MSTAAHSPPSHKTQTSAIVERLRRDIVAGVFEPGSKLKINELAQRYEAGVIPMREALSRLSSVGLVVAEDQRGFRVAPTSAAELRELSSLRCNLETQALAESISAGDLHWESALVAAHHRLQRMTERPSRDALGFDEEWDEVHVAFHFALLSACPSQWLMHFVEILGDQMNRYRHLSMRHAEQSQRDIAAEHNALFQAALRRDVDAAVAILRQHFARTEADALKAFETSR